MKRIGRIAWPAIVLLGAVLLTFHFRVRTPIPQEAASINGMALWATRSPQEMPRYSTDIAPLFSQYCADCHQAPNARAGIRLAELENLGSEASLVMLDKVAAALRRQTMPPTGHPRPTEAEQEIIETWLDGVVFRGTEKTQPQRERVQIRRLNRREYNNVIRDLIGLDLHPADRFPADDSGYGFDNIADVLSLSPVLLEKYLVAARGIVDTAFASPQVRERILHPPFDQGILLRYRQFIPPVREPVAKRLILSSADVALVDPQDAELQNAYEVLRAFVDRAYRRPATHAELTRLLRFVEDAQRNGRGAEDGIRLALQAVLVSPHFLFRLDATGFASADFALASRLSFFLWNSIPDEELFLEAAQGTLRESNHLASQVQRMLRDERSRSLGEDFASQWLQTAGLAEYTPDPALFPDFDEALRTAMCKETELFFDSVVREDRSIVDLLDADYTFVNERLARHYGLSGIHGDAFQRVSLAGSLRGGVLTQAGVLTITSNPTRTSPVKRGRWVMDNLLGAAPPSPPPGVDDLPERRPDVGSVTLRQRMELHRTNAACASCHRYLDPPGFGLENFNAIGAWRTTEDGQPIDASGMLPGGTRFDGPSQLRAILKARRAAFTRCLTEKLLTYALGRGLERADRWIVHDIASRMNPTDDRFSILIQAIVHSDPFINLAQRGKP